MNWEQLVKKQAKEFKAYLNGYKKSLDQCNADKALLLGSHTEANAPANVKDKISRDFEAWRQEWGTDGKRFQTMHTQHIEEINAFMANRKVSP